MGRFAHSQRNCLCCEIGLACIARTVNAAWIFRTKNFYLVGVGCGWPAVLK
jgi:hypothetical protein